MDEVEEVKKKPKGSREAAMLVRNYRQTMEDMDRLIAMQHGMDRLRSDLDYAEGDEEPQLVAGAQEGRCEQGDGGSDGQAGAGSAGPVLLANHTHVCGEVGAGAGGAAAVEGHHGKQGGADAVAVLPPPPQQQQQGQATGQA